MIEINGKNYTFNLNIKWGIFKKLNLNSEDPEVIEEGLKNILRPIPSEVELNEIGFLDIMNIMEMFGQEMQKKQTDYKKKLSQL